MIRNISEDAQQGMGGEARTVLETQIPNPSILDFLARQEPKR